MRIHLSIAGRRSPRARPVRPADVAGPTVVPHRAMALAGLALLLSACAPLPTTEGERAPAVPPAWSAAASAPAGVTASTLAWRDYFSDPLLQRLIQTALDHNRDLRIALLRTQEARVALNIQRASAAPDISLGAQAARARVPGDLNTSGRPVVAGEYRAELGLSTWELDLWGRLAQLNEAALQQWLATEAGGQAARTALVAQVADSYLAVRELDERVTLARRTLHSRDESLRIFKRRFEVGSASKLELTQVQLLQAQAQALLAQLEQARATGIHALGRLIGAAPGPLPAVTPFDDALTLPPLAAGLPSDLLAARPDIVAAEHRLAAARANIAAARAAFFPRIALTAAFGTASAQLDGLFDAGSRSWSFVPVVSLPIFDGGRRQASFDLAEIRRDVAVAEYEQSVQNAFREVADALAARQWLATQFEAQRVVLAAASERARLAQLRYDNGSATYLEVLDAQRDLLTAEQQRVQARRQLLSSQVSLYAALGGGSLAAPDAPAASTPSTALTR